MAISVTLQALFPQYLFYGIAEAVGIVTLYMSNHNTNEITEYRTELFNRDALHRKIADILHDESEVVITAFTIKDFQKKFDSVDSVVGDQLLIEISAFVRETFSEANSYYLDNYVFAVITDPEREKERTAVRTIQRRFNGSFKSIGPNHRLQIGLCRINLPEDSDKPHQVTDMLEYGSYLSLEYKGMPMTVNDVTEANRNRISELETQQKQLEEKYIETEDLMQKAVQKDKSKSIFLAQMSHEIRTPMTAILGLTELILKDSTDSKITEHANSIMSSGKTLLGIINDILDFSKIEAGKMEIKDEEYYITTAIYDVINAIEPRLAEKKLDFSVYIDPKLPITLFGDEIRVKQVTTNLLTNAVKYTEQGSVSLEILSEVNGDECEVTVRVKDTGIGIRQENFGKLFDGFERFDAQRNKAIEGTGLGLAICKQIVDAMGGRIDVESVYEQGSTFTVRMPQKVVNFMPAVVIDKPERFNLLIFCENESECALYKRTLQDFGIRALYVMTEEELLEAAADTSFTHIVITYDELERLIRSEHSLVKDPRCVITLTYSRFMADVGGRNVLHLPINCINLASMLVGSSLVHKDSDRTVSDDYAAPDAKLLVVDDNVVNLKIFAGLLEPHRMHIDQADSGNAGLEFSKGLKYDIIFLDHMMPRKDGIETLHELKTMEGNPNTDTPVIAFTANAVSGMKEMFLSEGFADFLSKPIDIGKLEEIIREYLPKDKILDKTEVIQDCSTEEDRMSETNDGAFSVKGMDMEKALFYTGGSCDALIAVLEVFLEDGRKKLEPMKQYVGSEDFENFRIEIHAVKSLCKGIGCDELSEKARLLEFACKDSDYGYVKENYEAVLEEYRQLLDNIDEALTAKDASENEEAVDESGSSFLEVDEQLTCVLALIHDFEEDLAAKLVNAIPVSTLEPAKAEAVKNIKKKLSLFDYEGAAKIIEEVLKG